MPELDAGPIDELPPGEMKLIEAEPYSVGVYNCDGELHAIEDRCSHDDGPLCHGNWEPERCVAFCPRHGANPPQHFVEKVDLALRRGKLLFRYRDRHGENPVRIEAWIDRTQLP